jgi:alpha-D-ribose 1-methylphosphonate 5-triphosphate diphosphatase
MQSFAITDATVVLPDRVLPGGAVAVREGRIAEVAEIEATGAFLLPGLVDLHNDGLELEVNPRPGAELSLDLAFGSFEQRLIASGVTTAFHAIAFMDRARDQRTGGAAAQRSAYVAELQRRGDSLVDHQVLHRIDVWSPEYLDAVFESVGRLPVGYVSLNDHTPG